MNNVKQQKTPCPPGDYERPRDTRRSHRASMESLLAAVTIIPVMLLLGCWIAIRGAARTWAELLGQPRRR